MTCLGIELRTVCLCDYDCLNLFAFLAFSTDIYLKTQSKKVKTSADCFTSADHQEVSKLGFKVSLAVNN